jgi:hypothetical protein
LDSRRNVLVSLCRKLVQQALLHGIEAALDAIGWERLGHQGLVGPQFIEDVS